MIKRKTEAANQHPCMFGCLRFCGVNTLSSSLLNKVTRNIGYAPVNPAARVRDVMAPLCLPASLLKIITYVIEGAKGCT